MKLRTKRLIYLSFFLIFFAVVPVLTLYATGYRYNFKKNQLEKTGILVIQSQPKKAEIYLNDRLKGATPLRLNRQLPDKYQLRVEKTGFHPWAKEIEIKSNLTTFQSDIVLFKKSLPIRLVEGQINLLAASATGDKIIYSLVLDETSEQLHRLDTATALDGLIVQFNPKTYNQLEFVAWSPDQSQTLLKKVIGDFNSYQIVDLEALAVQELFDLTRLNFDQLAWDQNSDNILYGRQKSALYKIDLINRTSQNVLAAHLTDFQVRGDDIYYITRVAQESFLVHSRTGQLELTSEKIKLPSPSNYTLQPSPEPYLVLLDKKNDDLFIITTGAFADLDLEKDIILQSQARDIFWSTDFKQLIYFTPFELWVYDFAQRQNNFINRFGKTIQAAVWYPDSQYIIYQTDEIIHATETNTVGQKNDIELVNLNSVKNISLDAQGLNLYFSGALGSQQGLYQLTLK